MSIHRRAPVRSDADTTHALTIAIVLSQIPHRPTPVGCNEKPNPRLQTSDTPICLASISHRRRASDAIPDSVPVCVQQAARVAPDLHSTILADCNDRTVSTTTFPQMPAAGHCVHPQIRKTAAGRHRIHPLRIAVWQTAHQRTQTPHPDSRPLVDARLSTSTRPSLALILRGSLLPCPPCDDIQPRLWSRLAQD